MRRAEPGQPNDLAAYAAKVTWARFNLDGVALLGGDLAIAGRPITGAEPEQVRTATSVVSERHHAANWLIGWSAAYGDVETPT